MKIIYRTMVGLISAIIVMLIAYSVIGILKSHNADFLVGWGSCVAYYAGIEVFDEWCSKHDI